METSGSSGPKANRKPPTQEERRKNIKRRDTILAAGSGVASSIINDVRANRKIDSRLPRGYDKGRIGRMALLLAAYQHNTLAPLGQVCEISKLRFQKRAIDESCRL